MTSTSSTPESLLTQKLSELKAICNASNNDSNNKNNKNGEESLNCFTSFQAVLIRVSHKLTKESEFKLAMEGLEIGAKLAMDFRDIARFERVFCQLKQFYNHPRLLTYAQNRSNLMGLYLMWLLSENRLAQFHTELELLTDADLQNNFIKFPMDIEQYMMEGSYNKIMQLRQNLPSKYFELFFARLEKTVRSEIAMSLESVHACIPLKDTLQMLNFATVDNLKHYITQREAECQWTVNEADNQLLFEQIAKKQETIDALVTARDMLEFANNIETIV